VESVFNRRRSSDPTISASLYNLIIGMVLLWGFALNWIIVENVPTSAISGINPWVFLIGYFATCFLGIYLFTSSDKPIVSFLGYNLVVVPFGFVLNTIVSKYDPAIVGEALITTGAVTGMMMVLGTIFPAFFKKISGALTVALITVIIVEVVSAVFFGVSHGIMDWIVALIFCGYIGVDWGRANSIPKTVDNAVDSAAALYMDIINLFVRILSILGNSND